MKSVNIGNPDCKRTLALLDAYLSNELSVETATSIFRHLDHCQQCQREFLALELVKNRLHDAVSADPVPPELIGKLARTMRRAGGSRFSRLFGRFLGHNGRRCGNK